MLDLYLYSYVIQSNMFPKDLLNLILSDSSSPDDSAEPRQDNWGVLFPSISLRDWSIQMMSAPSLRAAADSRTGLMREAWLFAPDRTEAR